MTLNPGGGAGFPIPNVVPGPIVTTGNVVAQSGLVAQTTIGAVGPGLEAGVAFGTAGTDVIYRAAANVLQTADSFYVGGTIRTNPAGAASAQVNVGLVGPASEAAIKLGGTDETIYRLTGSVLATGAVFRIFNTIDVGGASAAYRVLVGNFGPAAEAGLKFGSAGDTNLYRASANTLKTDDDFAAALDLIARSGAAPQSIFGAQGPGATAGMILGIAGDTNLYRAAANTLKTDDLFVAGAALPLQFADAGAFQTTVGAAGAAAALPVFPTKYGKLVDDSGATFVFPLYAAA